MKCVKMLGLVAVAAAALTAFAGSASATILTSPAGTTYTGTLKLASEGEITLDHENGFPSYSCSWSLEGKMESHGAAATATSKPSTILLTGCTTANSISVLNRGTLEFHTDSEAANGNGTITWVGFQLTITYSALGVSCLYNTGAGITLGTLTGSKTTGSSATVDLNSVKLPRTGDSIFCGAAATMTGSFKVITPSYLDVD